MGDGPFRDPSDNTQSTRRSRATYGGVAPIVQGMGDGNRTRDPYFTPPDNGQGQSGRASPFLEPPNFRPGGGGDQGSQPAPRNNPDLQPDLTTPKFHPKTPYSWSDPQPSAGPDSTGNGRKPAGKSELERTMGSRSSQLLTARERQTGSNVSKAIIAGTGGALLTEPLTKLADKGADKLMKAGEGTRSYAVGDWYKRNFTQVGSNAAELTKENSIAGKAAANIERTFKMDTGILQKLEAVRTGTPLRLTAEEEKHLQTMQKALGVKNPNAVSDGTMEAILRERQKLFKPVEETLADGTKVLKPTIPVTKTGAEEMLSTIRGTEATTGSKLFSTAEKGYLETQQLAFERMKILEDARLRGAVEGESKWLTAGGAWENAKRGFLYTLGTGGLLEADHNVRDRMYGTDAKSWETSSMTVPLAMALGKGFKGKALLGAGAIIGGHLLDNELPVPDWLPIPKVAKEFTGIDALTLGIAFSLPSKSKWVKAGTIAAAVMLGKAGDAAFLGGGAGDIETRALEAAKEDKTKRSYDSMERSVKDWKELGAKNEPVLEQNLANLLIDSKEHWSTMSQDEKLNSHRGTVAVARALGEYHLDHGTRLSAKAVDKPSYILDGFNMDLGGDALFYLQMAGKSVDGAKAMTEILLKQGKQANGTKVTESELKDLDSEKDKINADINSIYGKHDIEGAHRKFKKFLDVGETSSGATFQKELAYQKTFVEELNAKIARNWGNATNPDGSLNPEGAKVLAKLFRDQAFAKLGFAGYKLDHGDDAIGAGTQIWGTDEGRREGLPGMTNPDGTAKPKGYDGVIDELKMAERLDPGNKDLDELWALTRRLAEQVNAKVPDQWEKFDILNVRGK